MVFSDKKVRDAAVPTNIHNRLNLRDKSTEPSNLYGDANIRPRDSRQRMRAFESDSEDPPELETP